MDFTNHRFNVNVTSKKLNNVNVNQVRQIAQKLSDSLDDTKSFNYYCKVAWNLPESVIWSELEVALKKGHPAAYFTSVCNIKMAE